jgi:membrane associated rhomboid family serine protease
MTEFEILLRAPATLVLLIANIAISIAAFGNARLMDRLLFDMNRIRRFNEWYRMVTSGFIHGDPFHLFMNMLALFFLGPYLELLAIGTMPFLIVYMVSLVAGSLWTYMEHYRDVNYRALGASGAVSGVTTAAAMFFPFSTIYVLFALPMPMIVFAICYIIFSAWASRSGIRDGIGHAAHLGGALAGIAIVCVFWPEAPQAAWQQFVATLPTSL